jgi:hypoxanthine phosphoribosyltransferase
LYGCAAYALMTGLKSHLQLQNSLNSNIALRSEHYMRKLFRINDDIFEFYLSEKIIQTKITQIARKINNEYRNKVPVFIGILNGSFIFMADLLRSINLDCEVEFLKLSSYGHSKKSSGKVRLLQDLNCDLRGKDVIVVEDIVDSGLSADFIIQHIRACKPQSVKVVSLLLKEGVQKNDVKIDYIGFKIKDNFVIGYGLDYAQKARNLRDIYRLKKIK